jgi:hypothetical protein
VTTESTLYQMLVEDFVEAKASRFLKGYAERSDIIYKEADGASKEKAIRAEYAPYFNGQILFYLHQTMVLGLAEDCKLESRIQKCEQNGFPNAVVKIGRFHFTSHHGSKNYEIACLSPSMMRAQNSRMNLSLIQPNLFDRPFDPNKLREANNIYGNFIHGCRGPLGTFAEYGFMRIGFPCVADVKNVEEAQKKLRYVEIYNLYSVLESVMERESEKRSDAKPKLRVVPKIKDQ